MKSQEENNLHKRRKQRKEIEKQTKTVHLTNGKRV
jgi:hypothetical protein